MDKLRGRGLDREKWREILRCRKLDIGRWKRLRGRGLDRWWWERLREVEGEIEM